MNITISTIVIVKFSLSLNSNMWLKFLLKCVVFLNISDLLLSMHVIFAFFWHTEINIGPQKTNSNNVYVDLAIDQESTNLDD